MADSGVKAIVDEFSKLERDNSGRNTSYDEVLRFYAGSTLSEARKQGYISGVENALSSIFQPKEEDEDRDIRTPINLIKPAIENKVAFLSFQPTVRVIEPPDIFAPQQATPGGPGMPGNNPEAMGQIPTQPGMPPMGPEPTPTDETGMAQTPGPTNEDWGIDFADKLERVIASLLAQSNMARRCRDAAWSMCAMDGAVLGAWPDVRNGRPRIFVRTPQDFYPVAYDPDGMDLQKAMWKETLSGSSVAARYENGKEFATKDEVDVIQYIDEEKFCTILDKTKFAHPPLENKMGVVPIVCVSSLGLPGMIFGSNDFKDAIPVVRQINYHMSLIDEMSGALVRPTIAIKDPLNVPADIAIGRGGSFTMGKDGEVQLLGPLNLPSAFWQLSEQLQRWFDLISDNPAVLRAEGSNYLTGKGFNAQLGPIAARMQVRIDILMAAWKQVIKYMLLMWHDFPGMKKVKASGVKRKESYYIEAEPQEFEIDGEMWTEMDVFLSAQSYIDRQSNAVEIMQLYQNELIDWDSAVDEIPQVINKKRTRGKIDKDRQWKAEGLAIAQSAAQSAMTANVPIAAQEKTNYGLERGFMGETPPMPGPEGEATSAGAAAPMTEPEGEELIDVLTEFFQSIPKLRGSVWFGGDPILNPEKLADDNWKVTVWITDPLDKGTITRAAENVEIIYGHLQFIVGEPAPDENAIQVSGGGPQTSMMSPEPEEEEEEGMPPEMMMGQPINPEEMM